MKEFIFESHERGKEGYVKEYEVSFEVIPEADDCASFDNIYILDKETQEEVSIDSFSIKERVEIEERASDVAYECAYEVWFEREQIRADALYDQLKEEGYGQGRESSND